MTNAYPVWLTRLVYHSVHDGPDGWKAGTYAKAVTLPVPPFAGLGVIVDQGCDPEPFDRVYVNEAGAVVCELPARSYDADDELDAAAWEEHRAWLTAGWTRMPEGVPMYRLPPA